MGTDSRADSLGMDMRANVTLSGPALDVQHFVRLVEDVAVGGPVEGVPGAWRWVSERDDIVDRVIAHSMEFPDVEAEVEGTAVADGLFREEVWCWVANGNGSYERSDLNRLNKRLPADIVYDTIRYTYRLTDGKAALIKAVVYATEDDWSLDVTHYLR